MHASHSHGPYTMTLSRRAAGCLRPRVYYIVPAVFCPVSEDYEVRGMCLATIELHYVTPDSGPHNKELPQPIITVRASPPAVPVPAQ